MSSLLMAMMMIMMILYYMNGAGVGAGAAWLTCKKAGTSSNQKTSTHVGLNFFDPIEHRRFKETP